MLMLTFSDFIRFPSKLLILIYIIPSSSDGVCTKNKFKKFPIFIDNVYTMCYNIFRRKGKERKGKEFEMAKETQLHLRIDKETKDKAAKAAEQEGRTISNYIIRLIEKDWRMKNEK